MISSVTVILCRVSNGTRRTRLTNEFALSKNMLVNETQTSGVGIAIGLREKEEKSKEQEEEAPRKKH